MKKVNFMQKSITYTVVWGVFFGIILYFPVNAVFSKVTDPQIEFSTPIEDGYVFYTPAIEFTGKISSTKSSLDQLTVKVFKLQGKKKPREITKEGVFQIDEKDDEYKWSFLMDFADGKHTLSFEVADKEGNTNKIKTTFIVNTKNSNGDNSQIPPLLWPDFENGEEENETVTGPLISEIRIMPSKGVVKDMTNVPLDAKLILVVKDSVNVKYTKPFIITTESGKIVKSIEEDAPPEIVGVSVNDTYKEYYLPFTPVEPLNPATTYQVHVNHEIANEAGGTISPRFFQFTTVTNHARNVLHGDVMGNTNSCAYCHNTHSGKNESLIGGQYGNLDGDMVCMTCHDGTGGPPMSGRDKHDIPNKHDEIGGNNKNGNSCTSCHNPHIGESDDNPHKIQDYFEYKHTSEIGKINSQETLCETCHGPDDEKRNEVFSKNYYQVYSYKEMNVTDNANDFSLCFSCHDGNKASDIKKYYTNDTTKSGHFITAIDGSNQNGQMACADCHETHRSGNLYLLKDNLGRPDEEKFISGKAWSATTERDFCMTCHDYSIEMYGKTATLKKTDRIAVTVIKDEPDEETEITDDTEKEKNNEEKEIGNEENEENDKEISNEESKENDKEIDNEENKKDEKEISKEENKEDEINKEENKKSEKEISNQANKENEKEISNDTNVEKEIERKTETKAETNNELTDESDKVTEEETDEKIDDETKDPPKKGPKIEIKYIDAPIPGHQSNDTDACSSCHGRSGQGEKERIISAAHAPIRGNDVSLNSSLFSNYNKKWIASQTLFGKNILSNKENNKRKAEVSKVLPSYK